MTFTTVTELGFVPDAVIVTWPVSNPPPVTSPMSVIVPRTSTDPPRWAATSSTGSLEVASSDPTSRARVVVPRTAPAAIWVPLMAHIADPASWSNTSPPSSTRILASAVSGAEPANRRTRSLLPSTTVPRGTPVEAKVHSCSAGTARSAPAPSMTGDPVWAESRNGMNVLPAPISAGTM